MTSEHKPLGKSELRVSKLVLGTANFGSAVPEAEAIRMIHCAVDHGINMIDTADSYGMGEEITGRALKGRPDLLVATKVGNPARPGSTEQGLSPDHIARSLEQSLYRLKRDRIDLYQAHNWDYHTPITTTLRSFNRYCREGKVRAIGYSNISSRQLLCALGSATLNGLSRPVSVQCLYNLFERVPEKRLFRITRLLQLGVLVYSPLAGGVLTGKYNSEVPPAPETRASEHIGVGMPRTAGFIPQRSERNLSIARKLSKIAQREELTNVNLAIGWLLAKPVTAIIIGARNMPQLLEILETRVLPPSLLSELDEVTACA